MNFVTESRHNEFLPHVVCGGLQLSCFDLASLPACCEQVVQALGTWSVASQTDKIAGI